jgi:Clostridium epsilon toxin ETX/Bacillus mosquitocidal toxin MTX2
MDPVSQLQANSQDSVSQLRSHVQAWGNAFSKKYGTTCDWVDLYAENPDMQAYQQYKVIVDNHDMEFIASSPIEAPSQIFKNIYENGTSLEQQVIITFHKETSATFSWSITEGIDVGVQASLKAGLPNFAQGEIEVSTKISLSSTQEKSETDSQFWDYENYTFIPANTKISAQYIIMNQKYDVPFIADVSLSGYVAIWNKDKIDVNNPGGSDRHWLWFIPISSVFTDYPVQGYVVRGSKVLYQVHGTFKGIQGISSYLKLEEYPISVDSDQLLSNDFSQLPPPENTSIIPISGVQIRYASNY